MAESCGWEISQGDASGVSLEHRYLETQYRHRYLESEYRHVRECDSI